MNAVARRNRGFSLLEVMIVVAILGLLAAVAIPQFTSHKEEGRTAAMVSNLAILRTAIDSYWSQHDTFPGPTEDEFADHLLRKTNKAGEVGTSDDYGYGPYLRQGELPTNPFTNSNSVKVVDEMPSEPSGNQAWIYCPASGEVRSNATGKSPEGKLFFNL
jgi:type II secretion system protein G